MKRLICCLMAIVLAVGTAPLPAFARQASGLQGASPIASDGLVVQLEGHAVPAGPVAITFTNEMLCQAVLTQLSGQDAVYAMQDQSSGSSYKAVVSLDAENVAKVTRFSLVNCQVADISWLSGFTALTVLDLSHNLVAETKSLAPLANLRELNLYDNAVHDFSGLASLTQLRTLNLGENNEQAKGALSGLDALAGLGELTWLDFSENYAPDVTGYVKGLKKLEHLNLQQNRLTSVADLDGLVDMKTLILSSNSIRGVSALGNLTKLVELNLQSNALYDKSGITDATDCSGIDGLFEDPGASSALKLSQLKKLDLWGNWQWTDGFMSGPGVAHMSTLFEMGQRGTLELGYSYDRVKEYDSLATRNTKLSALPHTDAGSADVKYVTYDDFGARGISGYDDFNAMRNAHRFANANGCEVRATEGDSDAAKGKTYHIYRSYDVDYYNVFTNVDWQGATFVIHDENIDYLGARFAPLLCLRPSGKGATEASSAYKSSVSLSKNEGSLTLNPGWALGKATTSIAGMSPEVDSALAALAEKGYSRMYVMAYNSDLKQYRRFGSNENTGTDQWDGFIVDSQGKLEMADAATGRPAQAIQWDFSNVTKVVITPIPDDKSFIKNGNFITTRIDSRTECPYGRGGGKQIYYLRNLQIRDCSNVEVANITQAVGAADGAIGDDNELSGSYTGFLTVNSCADMDVHDCTAWARRYDQGGRSTYGLTMNTATNVTFTNFDCSNPWEQQLDIGGTRWGIMGTNHSKNVVFDRCTVNRIDAHAGFYNMTARDCKLGSWGFRLIGQGQLFIERCEVHSGNFIALRQDYGSTWDGDARIVDCTHYPDGRWSHSLVAFTPSYDGDGSVHEFGYELHYPNLTVENLTVNYENWSESDAYYIVPNFTYEGHESATRLPESYWPDIVDVRGIDFVNYEDAVGYKPRFRLVNTEEGTISGKLGGYSASGVNYNGVGKHDDVATKGMQLLEEERSIAEESFPLDLSVWDQLDGKDVAVEYAGEVPYMVLMDKEWHGWTGIYAYYIDSANGVAYFSGDMMKRLWEREEGTTWTDASGNSGVVKQLDKIRVTTDGETSLKHVALLDEPTEQAHVHEWSEWRVTKPAACIEPGERTKACAFGDARISVKLPELGHSWESDYTIDVAPTCTEGGIQSIHCSRCDERKGEEELDALGHDWGEWSVVRQPTYDSAGLEARTCKRDASHTERREAPALVRPNAQGEARSAVSESSELASAEDSQEAVEPAQQVSSSTKGVSAKAGKASVVVNVESSGTATLNKVKSAKGSVKVNTVKTTDGRMLKVTTVASRAFKGSAVTKVVLGANVKGIGQRAFQGCKKLKSVIVGKNVKSVGKDAFKGCKKLKTIKLASSKLSRKSCKQMLAGSKVRTVKLVGMSKRQRAKSAAAYAKWLPKSVSIRW